LRECVDGHWAECMGATTPSVEVCDGIRDEDCDTIVDNGCTCSSTESPKRCGTCGDGTQICDIVTGVWSECMMATTPNPCCPGQMRTCGTNKGECREGVETCTAIGTWSGTCTNNQGPVDETCNGRDDNCDGFIDNTPMCQDCIAIPTVLVDKMAPPYAGDVEFGGNGPQVWVTTTYRPNGFQVCADVSVRMLETSGSTPSEARKTVTQCSAAPGLVASVITPNSTHTYTDTDRDDIDTLTAQPGTGIGQIRCTGDTSNEDICNDQTMPGCSGCEVSDIFVHVTYR
jgi:hypothetical protein